MGEKRVLKLLTLTLFYYRRFIRKSSKHFKYFLFCVDPSNRENKLHKCKAVKSFANTNMYIFCIH